MKQTQFSYSLILDGKGEILSCSIHRAATAPDPVAHDVPDEKTAILFATAPETLAAAEEALDDLTTLGIDLDGEYEEIVAGIRGRLEDAIRRAKGDLP